MTVNSKTLTALRLYVDQLNAIEDRNILPVRNSVKNLQALLNTNKINYSSYYRLVTEYKQNVERLSPENIRKIQKLVGM